MTYTDALSIQSILSGDGFCLGHALMADSGDTCTLSYYAFFSVLIFSEMSKIEKASILCKHPKYRSSMHIWLEVSYFKYTMSDANMIFASDIVPLHTSCVTVFASPHEHLLLNLNAHFLNTGLPE